VPDLFHNPFYDGPNHRGDYGKKDDFNYRMDKTIRRVGGYRVARRAFKMKMTLGIFAQGFENPMGGTILHILIFRQSFMMAFFALNTPDDCPHIPSL
jgi:hypothetical protein